MKKILLFIFLTTGLWAQNPQEDVFHHPLESKTMDAFHATCSRLAEHPFIKGNFEQEKKAGGSNRLLKSSGNFIIAAELGMVWDTVKPFPSTMTLGKDYLIQSRPGRQKNVISAQGNETFIGIAEALSAVFSGNSQKLLDNFEIFYSGAVSSWELGLSPRNGAVGSFAEMIVMKGDTAIRSIQIFEQSGDTIQYFLSNHSYPAELNAHEKSFFLLP